MGLELFDKARAKPRCSTWANVPGLKTDLDHSWATVPGRFYILLFLVINTNVRWSSQPCNRNGPLTRRCFNPFSSFPFSLFSHPSILSLPSILGPAPLRVPFFFLVGQLSFSPVAYFSSSARCRPFRVPVSLSLVAIRLFVVVVHAIVNRISQLYTHHPRPSHSATMYLGF